MKGLIFLSFFGFTTLTSAAGTQHFTLNQFLEAYLNRSKYIQVQKETIGSSDEKVNVAFAQFLPTTTLNAEVSKTDTMGNERSRLIENKIETSSFLKLTQNIYNGNKDLAGYRISETQNEKSKADLETTRYNEILKGLELYYGYLKARVDLDNIDKEIDTNTKILSDLRKNFLNGNAKKSQVLSVQATIASNQIEKLEAVNSLTKALVNINRDLGTDYTALELSGSRPVSESDLSQLSPAARPDLLSAKLSSEVLYQQIDVQRASELPKIDLSGTYYLSDSSDLANNKNYYAVILGISIPFPWGIEKRALVSGARIEHNISLLNAKIKEDSLEKEKKLLIEEIASLKYRLEEIAKAKKIADETVRQLRRDFLAGLSSYSDYQNGSTSFQQIIRKYDQVKLDYELAMIKAEIWSGNVDKILK